MSALRDTATQLDVTEVLDRIAKGETKRGDLRRLKASVKLDGNRNVVQMGDHNFNVDSRGDVRIEQHLYNGVEAERIQDAISEALDGRGSWRTVGGVIMGVGYLVMVIGVAVFGLSLLTVFSQAGGADVPQGPPGGAIVGFGVGMAGGLVAEIGKVLWRWERPVAERGRRHR